MDTRTTVSMSASANFEVKRTIYSWKINEKLMEIVNQMSNEHCRLLSLLNLECYLTYLSFSVPKIDAKYSAIAI